MNKLLNTMVLLLLIMGVGSTCDAGGVVVRAPTVRVNIGSGLGFNRGVSALGFNRGFFPVSRSVGFGFAPVYRQRVILSAPLLSVGSYGASYSSGFSSGISSGLSGYASSYGGYSAPYYPPVQQASYAAPTYFAPPQATYALPAVAPAISSVLEERITTVERYTSGASSALAPASAPVPAMPAAADTYGSSGATYSAPAYTGTACPAGVTISPTVGAFLQTLPVSQQQAYLEARYATVFGRGVGHHIHRRFFPGGVFRRR